MQISFKSINPTSVTLSISNIDRPQNIRIYCHPVGSGSSEPIYKTETTDGLYTITGLTSNLLYVISVQIQPRDTSGLYPSPNYIERMRGYFLTPWNVNTGDTINIKASDWNYILEQIKQANSSINTNDAWATQGYPITAAKYNAMCYCLQQLNSTVGIDSVIANQTIILASHFNSLIAQAASKGFITTCNDYCGSVSYCDKYCANDCPAFGVGCWNDGEVGCPSYIIDCSNAF